jgi:hypothetical protein
MAPRGRWVANQSVNEGMQRTAGSERCAGAAVRADFRAAVRRETDSAPPCQTQRLRGCLRVTGGGKVTEVATEILAVSGSPEGIKNGPYCNT